MSNEEDNVDYIVNMVNSALRDVNLTKEQLLRPTSKVMINFYHKYLLALDKKVAGILNIDCQFLIGNTMFSAEEDVALTLYIFIHNITKQVGLEYFTLSDICKPTNRSKTTVKVLMNFLMYINSNEAVAREIVSKISASLKRIDELAEDTNTYKLRISELSSEIARDEEEYLKVKAENEAIKQFTVALNEKKNADLLRRQKLNEELLSLDEILNQHKIYLKSLTDDVTKLEVQIVNENDFEQSQAHKNKLEEKLKELQGDSDDYGNALESKVTQVKQVESITKVMDSIDISVLDVIPKIEERKTEIVKFGEANSAVQSEELKLNSKILENREKVEDLNSNVFSENCKFQNSTTGIRDEIKRVEQKIEDEKQKAEVPLKEFEAQQKNIKELCTKVDEDFTLAYAKENEVYRNMLHNETLLVSSFNEKLQDLTSIAKQ